MSTTPAETWDSVIHGPSVDIYREKHLPQKQAAPTQCTKFTCFPKLPIELRIQIWISSFPGPRMIGPASSLPHIIHPSGSGDWDDPERRKSDPIALRVNRESREIALEHYTRRDINALKSWQGKDKMHYEGFFDFSRDVLTLVNHREFCTLISDYPVSIYPAFMSKEEVAKVANVRLSFFAQLMNCGPSHDLLCMCMCSDLGKMLPHFKAVRSIHITTTPSPYGPQRSFVAEFKNEARRILEEYAETKKENGQSWTIPELCFE